MGDIDIDIDDNNNNNNKISVFTMDGTMKASQREQILSDATTSSRSIIANCRVLARGVDIPSLDLVVMADPVESHVMIRQMIGRVSRIAPGKTRAYVLIPMMMTDGGFDDNYIDNDDDDDSVMNDSYKNFFYSFDAMVGEDPKLYQDVLFVIDERSKLKRELKEDEFPPGILEAFELPSSWSLEKKNNMMNCAITEYSKFNHWDKMYELLLVYKDREGHCNVPSKDEEGGEKLGIW